MNTDTETTFIRTLGDGMDNSLLAPKEKTVEDKMNMKINHRLSSAMLKSFQPVEFQGPVFNLIPNYIPKEGKKPKYLIKKPKEPKFIPYEPYKAAVRPILPNTRELKKDSKPSKNNIDIQDLVTQMTDMRIAEMNRAKIEAVKSDEGVISKKQWEAEKKAYETDIKNLRETNSHLENQLKFQAQVNSELKTLLVAAVGEDLETRVQHLTEDKLQLARALLNSANHITSHQEQTEWLSGQCEVWRSKFLASSLMVEELARWKSALTKRINELQECIMRVLDERMKVRKSALKMYGYLSELKNHYCLEDVPLQSTNIIDLTNANFHYIKDVYQKILAPVEIDKENINVDENISKIQNTLAESLALKVMQNTDVFVNKPDSLSNSLIGAAMSLTAGQFFHHNTQIDATCCGHCRGEVQNI